MLTLWCIIRLPTFFYFKDLKNTLDIYSVTKVEDVNGTYILVQKKEVLTFHTGTVSMFLFHSDFVYVLLLYI
jgi:hypothetical protein